MSYILDSLKKSEQQRRQGELPNLQSDHPGSTPPAPRKRGVWPWLVVAVLLVNAGALAWWLTSAPSAPQPGRLSKPGVSQVQTTPDTPAPTASRPSVPNRRTAAVADPDKSPAMVQAEPEKSTPEKSTPKPLTENPNQDGGHRQTQPQAASPISQPPPAAPPAKASQPAPRPPAVAGSPAIIPLEDLPAEVRSGLPDLKLSLLYYTAAPEKRLARLNGKNLREGDTVETGVTLKEIRPEGAVISFRGKLILLPRP